MNTAALISGQVVVKGLGLLWLVVVARHLGEAGFGTLNLALTLAGLFGLFVELGLSPVMTRAVARRPELAGAYQANVLGMRLLLAVLVIPVTVAASLPFGVDRSALPAVAIVAATVLTASVGAIPSTLFVARERMIPSAVIQSGAKVVALAAGLALVHRGAGLAGVAAVFLLEGALQTVIGFAATARLLGLPVRVELDRELCRGLLRESLPFVATLALGLIYFKVDVLMLSAMQGSEAVGRYSAAFRLMEGLVYLAAAYAGALFPTLARLKTTSVEALRLTTHRATDAVIAFALPAAVALAMLAEPVIRVLYGPEYAESVAALRWIGGALFFVFVAHFLGSVLGAVDRQDWTLRATLVGVALNVSLNLWLIPRLSHVGAAVATLVTQAAVAIVLAVLVRRVIGPDPDVARRLKIVVATAAMAGTLHVLRGTGPVPSAAAGAVVYAAALAILRVLSPEEIARLRSDVSAAGESR